MAWRVKARLREVLAAETGPAPKDPGGRLNVALIWPGTYRTALSALGYLSIYGFLNSRPDVLAERFFWPDGALAVDYEQSGSSLLSLESGRPLHSFDLVAASLALENDYWLLLAILSRAGLAPERSQRAESDPPVLVGGVAVWANPWPVMSFVDLILTGEAEAQWPQLISVWDAIRFSPLPKIDRLRFVAQNTPGSFQPGSVTEPFTSLGEGDCDFFLPPPPSSAVLVRIKPAVLLWPPPVDLLPPVAPIVSPRAEFSGTRLVEISRGCPYGCRFCLAGALFRPHRPWPLAKILAALTMAGVNGEKIGLISPAAADHPDLAELLTILFQRKHEVTLASLRLTALTRELAEKLAAGRLQGVAVAPEAGSQVLRDRLNKALTEEQILAGVRLLAEAGLKKIKLYFLLGLPGETDQDLAALVELVMKIRVEARYGARRPELLLSLANFTPKAHTPFEEAAMDTEAELRRKGLWVSHALKGIVRLKVNLDPPLWSITQGLLARGGIESGRLVAALFKNQGRLRASLSEVAYRPDHPLHRPWPRDKPKPWHLVQPAEGVSRLEAEWVRAGLNLPTPPCPPENNCGRCKACN